MIKKESDLPVRIVCATRSSRENFLTHTLTGKSIKSFIYTSKVEGRLFPENKIGLGEVYNKAIEEARTSPAILVFMHDDAVIGDYFWADRIRSAIKEYQIIGVAGNTHRSPRQSSWCFLDDKWTWDDVKNLSGCIGHGASFPPSKVLPYGPSGKECKLLEGLLLAANSEILNNVNLKFDPRFRFHFYDMDFCRQAELLGLRMGTFSLALMHASAGGFDSPDWREAYQDYLDKWVD